MGIKIVKKRQAGDVRAPAPLVEPEPTPQPVSIKDRPLPVDCTYCGHPYIHPCHGKSAQCMNKRFVDRRKQGN